ncbi:MAG TPA: hypothetical protein VGG99_11780 [Acetobacteraceae bacterium]|jgi:hypothetical protein
MPIQVRSTPAMIAAAAAPATSRVFRSVSVTGSICAISEPIAPPVHLEELRRLRPVLLEIFDAIRAEPPDGELP